MALLAALTLALLLGATSYVVVRQLRGLPVIQSNTVADPATRVGDDSSNESIPETQEARAASDRKILKGDIQSMVRAVFAARNLHEEIRTLEITAADPDFGSAPEIVADTRRRIDEHRVGLEQQKEAAMLAFTNIVTAAAAAPGPTAEVFSLAEQEAREGGFNETFRAIQSIRGIQDLRQLTNGIDRNAFSRFWSEVVEMRR
jgi:hypothetical protein